MSSIIPETPHLFPLSRVSTDEQVAKSGHERQQQGLQRLSERFGLPLAPVMQLDGISGFKGDHVKDKTPLGLFIKAVSEGLVAEGSILVADDHSRLSRMEPTESSHLLTGILIKGVGVYFSNDDTLILKGEKNVELALMMSLWKFSEAHEASKQKQRFTYSHARGMAQRFLDNDSKAFRSGRPLAIKSMGAHPWWIDTGDGTVRKHKFYFKVAREITEKLLSGWGSYRVVDWLNENHPPPTTNMTKANSTKRDLKRWGQTMITRWVSGGRDALTGTRRLTFKDSGEEFVLDGYYPTVATLAEVKRIQKQKDARRGSQSSKHSSMLTGINVLKCGYCGYAMTSFIHRGKLRCKCNGGAVSASNCKSWGFNLSRLEDICCRLLVNHVWNGDAERVGTKTPLIKELSDSLDKVKARITETETAIIEGTVAISVIGPALEKLKGRQQIIEAELKELDAQSGATRLAVDDWKRWGEITPKILDLNEDELRTEVKELMRVSLAEIRCYRGEKERQQRIEIELRDGTSYQVWNYTNKVVLSDNALDGAIDFQAKAYHLYHWIELEYELEIKGKDIDWDKLESDF